MTKRNFIKRSTEPLVCLFCNEITAGKNICHILVECQAWEERLCSLMLNISQSIRRLRAQMREGATLEAIYFLLLSGECKVEDCTNRRQERVNSLYKELTMTLMVVLIRRDISPAADTPRSMRTYSYLWEAVF